MRMIELVRRLMGRSYPETMGTADRPTRHVAPVELAHLLHQVPGQWVALRDGEIIEARATLDELMFRLHDRAITDANVMRAPAEHEAEMVGLG